MEKHALCAEVFLGSLNRLVIRSESVSAFGVVPRLCASVEPGVSHSDDDDELQLRCRHFARCG